MQRMWVVPPIVAVSALLVAAATVAALPDSTPIMYSTELVADDEYLYWAEASVKEFDDDPVYISRAAVKRRAHGSQHVEVVFDFKRDDTFCTPRKLALIDRTISWLCKREFLEGNARSDPTRYMQLRGGALRNIAMPDARPDGVATNEHDLFIFVKHDVMRVDLVTGARTHVATMPPALASSAVLTGATATAVIGQSRRDGGWVYWAAARGAITELSSVPAEMFLAGAAVGEDYAVIGWGSYSRGHTLTVLGAGALRRGEYPMTPLLIRGNELYFLDRNQIHAIDLRTKQEHVIVEAKPDHGIAIGGGWLYWQEAHQLRRHQL